MATHVLQNPLISAAAACACALAICSAEVALLCPLQGHNCFCPGQQFVAALSAAAAAADAAAAAAASLQDRSGITIIELQL